MTFSNWLIASFEMLRRTWRRVRAECYHQQEIKYSTTSVQSAIFLHPCRYSIDKHYCIYIHVAAKQFRPSQGFRANNATALVAFLRYRVEHDENLVGKIGIPCLRYSCCLQSVRIAANEGKHF